MGSELDEPRAIARQSRAPTLSPHRVLLVRVAGFTFEFHTLGQVRACLAFYERKLQPSGRSADRGSAVAEGKVSWRHEVQRWHERLPLYLRDEPARQEVVAAMRAAVLEAEAAPFE